METDRLIEKLMADLAPVRPVARPVWRLVFWLLISLPAAGLAAWLMGFRADLAARFADPAFLAAQAAALLTAVIAGYAALCAGLPDEPRWKLWLPWAAFGIWLATLGKQCWEAWILFGHSGLVLQQDAMCLPAVAMTAIIPALAIVVLLRRGTCVRSGWACLFGALAAASLGDLALRLCHPVDAALTVIVWQLGSVALFSAAAGALARYALGRATEIRRLRAGV